MTDINEILSPELRVRPLKQGEKKEFVLLRAGWVDPNFNGGQPISPAGHVLPGEDTIQDPHDDLHPVKTIQNIKSFRPVRKPGEPTIYDPVIEAIRFPRTGRIVLTHLNNGTYLFLMRHNKNRDNSNRLLTFKPVFYVVDEKRDAEISRALFRQRTLAGSLLLQLDSGDLVSVAKKLNKEKSIGVSINITKEPEYIREKLQPVTQSHPGLFIEFSDNIRAFLEVLIDSAIRKEVILFDADADVRTWFWIRSPKQKGPKKICQLEVGNMPIPGLIDFLLSPQGKSHYTELVNRRQEYYQ